MSKIEDLTAKPEFENDADGFVANALSFLNRFEWLACDVENKTKHDLNVKVTKSKNLSPELIKMMEHAVQTFSDLADQESAELNKVRILLMVGKEKVGQLRKAEKYLVKQSHEYHGKISESQEEFNMDDAGNLSNVIWSPRVDFRRHKKLTG